MVIDSSALLAVFFGEPEAVALLSRMIAADVCRLSAAILVEMGIMLRRDTSDRHTKILEEILRTANIQVEPVTEEQVLLAIDAFVQFGKGTGHPAGLNYGDCFSYALAKAVKDPLLHKGYDFAKTDIAAAAY